MTNKELMEYVALIFRCLEVLSGVLERNARTYCDQGACNKIKSNSINLYEDIDQKLKDMEKGDAR